MNEILKTWRRKGTMISYGPFRHQMFVIQEGNPDASPERTLLLIHGFPESSFSFHKIINGVRKTFDRIILFDMLGYGFSDKPTAGFTYSLFEQADSVLTVWKHFGITGGHMLSHDMGDSIATELVARHENQIMPGWFSDGFKSITFTNGSMVLEMADLRITQKLLLSDFGHLLKNLTTFKLFQQQVISAHGNNNLTDLDIANLWDLNCLKDGHRKTYLTIKYLKDRKRFEKTRWLPALAQTSIPIHLCWGDKDAVARINMAYFLKENICKNATLTIMKGLGHFCQIGSPDKWVEYVIEYYKKAELR